MSTKRIAVVERFSGQVVGHTQPTAVGGDVGDYFIEHPGTALTLSLPAGRTGSARLAAGEIAEEVTHERRHRGIQLRGTNPSKAMGLFINGDGDVSHGAISRYLCYTVYRLHSSHRKSRCIEKGPQRGNAPGWVRSEEPLGWRVPRQRGR